MKKELVIIFGICLFAVIVAGIFASIPRQNILAIHAENNTIGQIIPVITTESSEVAGRISHNIILQPALSMAANAKEMDKVLIYKTESPVVTNEITLDYAKKFNVTGPLKGGQVVQSKDLRYGIRISNTSGCVEYVDQDRPNHLLDSPDKLPTDEEAVTIATKFLKDRNLYPEGATEPLVMRENTYTIGKRDQVYYGAIGVWYHRYLNGMSVEGTRLGVYVGGNGDVIEYYANWRNYTPYKEYPITPMRESFNKLKDQGVPVGMNDPKASAVIDEAYLAYQTTPGAYSEDFLQPVWVFKGNVLVDGKPVKRISEFIPALKEKPDKIIIKPVVTIGTQVSTTSQLLITTILIDNTTLTPVSNRPASITPTVSATSMPNATATIVANETAIPSATTSPVPANIVPAITANETTASPVPTAAVPVSPLPTTLLNATVNAA